MASPVFLFAPGAGAPSSYPWMQHGAGLLGTLGAVHAFELSDSPTKLGTLAAELGMNSRYFIRIFREQVGMTPKAYGRILRFQAALRRIHGKRDIDWVSTAWECGYYDQSHFIRDFRSFSGITPGAYEKLQGERMNHVRLPEHGHICPIPDKNIRSKVPA